MKLTATEIEQAAELLCNSTGGNWAEYDDKLREGYRMIVIGIAKEMTEPRTLENIAVFMAYMADGS